MTDTIDLDRLPDYAVLSQKQTQQLLNLSTMTMWRMRQSGDAPPRLQISPRKTGYRVADLRKWIAARAKV